MLSPAVPTPQPGFTRANVAVVLAILVLLGGLVVTGVNRVRETAAEAKCKNNLKQIVIGMHAYLDVANRLPPLVDQGEGSPTGRGLPSVFATLEPYLEASYWHYRPGRPPKNYHAPSSTVFEFEWKDRSPGKQNGGDANQAHRLFICLVDATADRLRDVPVTLPDGSTGHYATGSYAANGLLSWGVGKLPVNSSSLVAFAERPQACRTAAGETVHNLWGVGFYSPQMPAFAALSPPGFASTGQIAPVTPLPAEEDAASLRVRIGTRDAPPQEPDFASPIQRIRAGESCDPRLPGSPHRGGMQVAMADGTVRAFGWDTTPWVWWSACVPSR